MKLKNKYSSKNKLSYILLIIFVIFEVLSSIISFVLVFLADLSMEDIENYNECISTDIVFIILTFFVFAIPIISTIIQFFFNKKSFKDQLIILVITMIFFNIGYITDLIRNIGMILKNLAFKI